MKKEAPGHSIIIQPATSIDLLIAGRSGRGLVSGVRDEVFERCLLRSVTSKLVRSLRAGHALKETGDRLLALAEHNFTLRRIEEVERLCLTLLSLPLEIDHHSGALYYYSLCKKRQGNPAAAKPIFERLAEEATLRFRAKAISSLAALAIDRGDYHFSLELYCEYTRITIRDQKSTLADVVQAHRSLAVMKSIDGDHRGSLSYLEKLLPLAGAVRRAHPHTYYDYLNSLAVELSEAGRIEEAQNASSIAVSSVFAPAYHEWRETGEEIAAKAARKSRSFASVGSGTSKPASIALFPPPDAARQPAKKKGRKLTFQKSARK